MLSSVADTPSFVVLGADAYLTARPATPIQMAHACRAAGFDVAIPAAWGDELIALDCARQLVDRTILPAVFCACERVYERLMAPGPELAPFLIRTAAPPVATARYLRELYRDAPLDITYVGTCPSARDPIIDRQIEPATFLADLAQRGIDPTNEATVFQAVFAPDRRRCYSLPGGLPTDEMLQGLNPAGRSVGAVEPLVARCTIEITADEYAADLAQYLLLQEPVLLDLAPRLGCVCSGAVGTTQPGRARSAVVALEPPRSPHPIVDPAVSVDLHVSVDDGEGHAPEEDPAADNNGQDPGGRSADLAAVSAAVAPSNR